VQAQSGLVVTYHETLADAESQVNPIQGVYTNINASIQVLFVRVENVGTSCFTTGSIDLIVDPGC
jgi:hypothetical protein